MARSRPQGLCGRRSPEWQLRCIAELPLTGVGIGRRSRACHQCDVPSQLAQKLLLLLLLLLTDLCGFNDLSDLAVYHQFNRCNGIPKPIIRAFRFRKNIAIWFDFPKQFDSAHHCRIGYYRLLHCQMSTLLRHQESHSQLHQDVGCDVSYNNRAESNRRFFNKTNLFESICPNRERNALLIMSGWQRH